MKKIINVQQCQLPLDITRDKDGYIAVCPLWSDCYAQGDSIDEVIAEAQAVAISLIELYREEDKSIPLKAVKEMKMEDQFSLNVPLVIAPT